jgi:hypothetical protein
LFSRFPLRRLSEWFWQACVRLASFFLQGSSGGHCRDSSVQNRLPWRHRLRKVSRRLSEAVLRGVLGMNSGVALFWLAWPSDVLPQQNRKLRDATKFLLVPTFLLDNKQLDKTQGMLVRSSYTHTTHSGPRRWQNTLSHNLDDDHGGELAADVVLRSSAAPTYFPSHQGCTCPPKAVRFADCPTPQLSTAECLPTIPPVWRLCWPCRDWARYSLLETPRYWVALTQINRVLRISP